MTNQRIETLATKAQELEASFSSLNTSQSGVNIFERDALYKIRQQLLDTAEKIGNLIKADTFEQDNQLRNIPPGTYTKDTLPSLWIWATKLLIECDAIKYSPPSKLWNRHYRIPPFSEIVDRRKKILEWYTWMTSEQKSLINISEESIDITWIWKFTPTDAVDLPFLQAKEDIWIASEEKWRKLFDTVLVWWSDSEKIRFLREVFWMKRDFYWVSDDTNSQNMRNCLFVWGNESKIEFISKYTWEICWVRPFWENDIGIDEVEFPSEFWDLEGVVQFFDELNAPILTPEEQQLLVELGRKFEILDRNPKIKPGDRVDFVVKTPRPYINITSEMPRLDVTEVIKKLKE
jgi:hypothetical protein